MKFSIKYKMIALGAVLSILVTTIALLFSNYEYRRRGRENQLYDINKWLEATQGDLENPNYGLKYIDAIIAAKNYILQQYEIFPDDPPEGATEEEKKYFYMNYFKWMYAIENLGMYPMTEEELDFRNKYETFCSLLTDAKSAANGSAVYVGFVTEEKTLFYIADTYSYRSITRPDCLYPGSRTYNFDAEFVLNGKFYDVNTEDAYRRALPVIRNETTVAYVFVQYDFKEVDSDANSLMKTEIIALSIASAVILIAYFVGAHFLLIKNMTKLTKSAEEFSNDLTKGKTLEVKDPHIKSKDEIHVLSDSFIALENGIINYIDVLQKETQAKERMNAELSIATNIQLSALPNCVYDDKDIAVRSFIKSAKEVGGDFYDYFYLDDHRFVVLISDVSGKGIPAALFMMKSKELLKSAIHRHDSLVDAVNEVNTTLVKNNKESLFVTSFIGIIDLDKNKITYVNAGHEKPYIVSNNKVIKLEGESNFVMGGEDGFIYKQESHAFNKGDFIFLFTDGLNESINKNKEEFSYSRIEATLDKYKDLLPLDNIIDKMNEELEEFVKKEEQFDDVTMVIVKYRSNELHLSYDKKDYSIIEDIVNHFNDEFAFVNADLKASTGIVIDELVNNLISYEKRDDLLIDVDFSLNKNDLEIRITSNGDDYDPFANHKEKYLEEFHPEIKEGGFGLSIIKHLAKSCDYKYKNHHSIVTIIIPIEKKSNI